MIVHTHRIFNKKFVRLSQKLKVRFKERRDLFLQEPFHPLLDNHALTGDRIGQWSINVTGDWRAIYEFLDSEAIIFMDIDTHSNLYK